MPLSHTRTNPLSNATCLGRDHVPNLQFQTLERLTTKVTRNNDIERHASMQNTQVMNIWSNVYVQLKNPAHSPIN